MWCRRSPSFSAISSPGVLAGSGSAFDQMMANGLVLAGTVDDVKRQMEEMYKAAPFDPTLPKAQGQEGLRKMITEAAGTMKPRPFIHNHVIELLGPDRAKGTCYVEVRMTREGKKWLMTGWYDDEYVKVGGEWKFQSRKTTIDSFGPLSKGV